MLPDHSKGKPTTYLRVLLPADNDFEASWQNSRQVFWKSGSILSTFRSAPSPTQERCSIKKENQENHHHGSKLSQNKRQWWRCRGRVGTYRIINIGKWNKCSHFCSLSNKISLFTSSSWANIRSSECGFYISLNSWLTNVSSNSSTSSIL